MRARQLGERGIVQDPRTVGRHLLLNVLGCLAHRLRVPGHLERLVAGDANARHRLLHLANLGDRHGVEVLDGLGRELHLDDLLLGLAAGLLEGERGIAAELAHGAVDFGNVGALADDGHVAVAALDHVLGHLLRVPRARQSRAGRRRRAW